MASSNSIRAGQAFVEVYAENKRLRNDLRRSESDIKMFGQRAKAMSQGIGRSIGAGLAGILGGVGAASVANTLKETISQLHELNKVSKAFGMSAESSSGLFGVMKSLGASNIRENIESLVTLNDRIQQAASSGDGQGAKLFEGLNVTAKELKELDPAEQFYRLHNAILQLEEPADRITKLMLAFGEDGGKTLVGTLSMTNAELRKSAENFKLNQDQLDQASEAQLALNAATAEWNKLLNEIATDTAPILQGVAVGISDLIKNFTEANKAAELFQTTLEGIEAAVDQPAKVHGTSIKEKVNIGIASMLDYSNEINRRMLGENLGGKMSQFRGRIFDRLGDLDRAAGNDTGLSDDLAKVARGQMTPEQFEIKRLAEQNKAIQSSEDRFNNVAKRFNDVLGTNGGEVGAVGEEGPASPAINHSNVYAGIAQIGQAIANAAREIPADLFQLPANVGQLSLNSASIVGSTASEQARARAMMTQSTDYDKKQLDTLKDINRGIEDLTDGLMKVVVG